MSKKYIVGVLVGFFACFFGNAFGRAMRECLHNHRKWNGSGAIYNVTGESHCEFSALSGLALIFPEKR